MKKNILIIVSIFLALLFVENVKAMSFKEGDFIQGEYIKKVKDGKTNYMTVQFIRDENNNFIYCLEPYVLFSSGTGYNEYNSNLEKHTGLSSEQIRRIKLLAYYGYNYPGRMGNKWYAITQYLIWKTVDPSDSIYFTDTLNGNKISKYENEIASIEQDLKKNDLKPSFIKEEIKVDYKSDIDLIDSNNILNEYKIMDSDFDYEIVNNEIRIKNIVKDGKITLKRKHEIYNKESYVYINTASQDLFKVGNPEEETLVLGVNVRKGNILMNIYDDDSVYTVEKDFSNTCYGIYDKDNKLIEKVCTDKGISYKTEDLSYGEYYIKQESNGIGYKKDENVYNITIDEKHEQAVVELKNKLIRNNIQINKKYCKDNDCLPEEGATFEIYDINDNLVKAIKTDSGGYTDIELGYGSYQVVQILGKEGYTLTEKFTDRIEDETTDFIHYLKDNFVTKEQENTVNKISNVQSENDISPPDTAVKGLFDSLIQALKEVVKTLKSLILCLKKG